MGSLRSRIKATLLRRDSQPLSPGSSNNGSAGDRTSGACTHSQPEYYDASDELSGHGLSASRSSSPERAASRSTNSSHLDNNISFTYHNPSRYRAHHKSRREQGQHRDSHANGSGSTTPRGQGPARLETSARPAPQSVAHSDPPAATTEPERDLHNLATIRSSPANLTQQTTAADTATGTGTGTGNAGNTNGNTTNDNNNNNNNNNNTDRLNIDNHNSSSVNTSGNADGSAPGNATDTTALPSIHEHPAPLPTLSPINPELEVIPSGPLSRLEADNVVDPVDLVDLVDEQPHRFSHLLSSPSRPPLVRSSLRRQSIVSTHLTEFGTPLNGYTNGPEIDAGDENQQHHPFSDMVTRKIWVKRPMASATLITINESDLVDDVRDQILRKYANSLGRQYDAPDITLRICSREQQTTRTLQPDEFIVKVIDSYFPNNQTVDDALLIDIPSRRTPKASPNPKSYADERPHESGTDYFPPYPPPSHSHHPVTSAHTNGQHSLPFPPSMSILGGNQLPPLPSPGSTRRLVLNNRPNAQRMHTASPVSTVGNSHSPQMGAASTGTHKYSRPTRSRTHSGASSDQSNHQPSVPPVSTPPPVERTATPPPRVASPRPYARTKKKRVVEPPSLPPGLLDNTVPPINILIVEDNIINLRLLEAFVKRLKVRWQTAVNGKEAVDKWRAGGFHLVLMDIQLPIMSGLEATREIRRIEKVNSIGVFSSSANRPPDEVRTELAEEDKLANTEMFKSPVIIVALTASSLQSDRHEALAAGCNDFLTKPVNFDWLERKVKEWGCMQALIDFDGWRKWKDFSQKTQADEVAKKPNVAGKAKPVKKARGSTTATS